MSSMNPTVKRILPWVPLIVALVLGLVLGLLIGWVWWPVSWTNASIADLSTTQRAEYVGAVAEAYHFDGTTAARQRMEARLAPFGANTDDALTGAIEYYRSLPEPDEVMVANLALLATDLGIPVDAAMMAPDPNAAPVDAAAAPAEAAVTDAAAADKGGSGIFTWLLAVILSVALIGAGFYLLMRLRAPRELADSMKEPSAPGALQPVAGGKSPTPRTSAWGRKAGSSAAATATAVADDDDLSFDDDDAEEPAVRFNDASGDTGAPDADDDFDVATPRYASARADAESYGAYSGASYDAEDDYAGADAGDDNFADDPFADDERADAAVAGGTAVAGTPVAIDAPIAAQPAAGRGPGGGPLPADAPPVDINALTPPSWATVETKGRSKASESSGYSVTTTGVAVAAPAQAPATRPIATFTLQYYAGVSDYIEAHNITDPTTGKYIGECGMGVSGKNPVLQSEPNQVIALDVWMYDKLDARENVNSTRVLLSPYAVAQNLAQAFGDASGNPTLEARKGARFGVDGRNLFLEGELQDVDFDANGVFRTARVRLNVLPKV